MVRAYQQAERRLLLLDYDGTLRPFAPTPNEAVPGTELLALLQRLAEDPRNTVVIVSGRPCETLDAWLGALPLDFVAEHGFFSRRHGGQWRLTQEGELAWKQPVITFLENAAAESPDSFVEVKASAVVWHYRKAKAEDIAERVLKASTELARVIAEYDVVITTGHKIVEVRVEGVHKGIAIEPWLQEGPWDFILAAGDDKTDEDLFEAVPEEAFTVKVGGGQTAAKLQVADSKAILALLNSLK